MFGNLFLILSILSLWGLVSITASPMPGGDRGVGYAFAMFFAGVGFLLFTGLLAWNLGVTHKMDWISSANRNWLIAGGWIIFAIATMAGALFYGEWHDGELPGYLRWLALSRVSIWLPILVLIPVAWSINAQSTAKVPIVINYMLKAGMGVSLLMCAGVLAGYFMFSAKRAAAMSDAANERDQSMHAEYFKSINSLGPDDPILNILALTGRFHDQDVREAAVAKVKSHPDWEAELIRLLNDTEWHSQVYQFIDGNQVDHPELFVQPIKNSLLRIAADIKQRIKSANWLDEGSFGHFSIDRCLRAIDEQFGQVPGADFTPEVTALRNALDTPRPERFKDVQFTGTAKMLDKWLKKNRK